MIELFRERLGAMLTGFQVRPDPVHWVLSLLLVLLYGAFALWFGERSGLIRKQRVVLTIWQQVWLGFRLWLHPAILEESIFRGLLLPQPSRAAITPPIAAWFGISILLFVLIHPLNGLLVRTR